VFWIVLPKIAFWMVVIGAFALLTPNPAWPAWAAKSLIGAGIATGVLGIAFGARKARRAAPPKKEDQP